MLDKFMTGLGHAITFIGACLWFSIFLGLFIHLVKYSWSAF
jgi:hypothetical protein